MIDLSDSRIHPDTRKIIEYYDFQMLPVEGTLYKNIYQSAERLSSGGPVGTAMVGLYAQYPHSASCFHRLEYDEVWHVYGGDPFHLILLYEDGTSEDVRMGSNPWNGEHLQYVVPKHTWQAGYMEEGGRYSLYGCTMSPGFVGACFQAGIAEELIQKYPDRAALIQMLSAQGEEKMLPETYC